MKYLNMINFYLAILIAFTLFAIGSCTKVVLTTVYRSSRTLAINSCVEFDSEPEICESWKPKCNSHSVDKIKAVGKAHYQTVHAQFDGQGNLLPWPSLPFSSDIGFDSAKFYRQIECPVELGSY